MVAFSSLVSAGLLAAASVNAAPARHHQKRIAQVIADSTTKWVAACTKAGGAADCGTISQTAFTTLLAAGKNCDQQDAADQMVDLAKKLKNDPDMIKFAQLFVQQPRNAPDSLAVPYCQTAPKNAELNGLFHCQFQGDNQAKFSGDQTGNLPLGVQAVNPPGSCPANPAPIADGTQLTDITQDPGTPEGASGGAAAGAGAGTAAATGADAGAGTAATGAGTGTAATGAGTGTAATGAGAGTAATTSTAATAGANNAAAGAGGAAPAAGGFKAQNGKDAQALNDKFAGLNANSPCTDGDQACVGGGFAQCVGGKFQVTQCAGGTQCFALPLVNKAGTSITCTTAADAQARIAASGA